MNGIRQFENLYGIRLDRKIRREMTALMCCAEMVLAFSYLGYLAVPPISVTTMHIFVIVAALFFGPLDASAVACIFALSSMWKATDTSTEIGDIIFSPFRSGNPAGSILMSFVSRIIFAVVAGYAFRLLSKKNGKHRDLAVTGITAGTTLLHSLLVYIPMVLFFGAADAETGESFSAELLLNNALLYSITIAVVLICHKAAETGRVKEFFSAVCRAPDLNDRRRNTGILVFVFIIPSVLICLHLMNRVDVFLAERGPMYDEGYLNWVYALILQLMLGFFGVTGVLYFISKWMREYNAAKALEETHKAAVAAKNANAAKTSFLNAMSHDIRTPMNAIAGYTRMAEKNIDDKEAVAHYLEKIDVSGQQLLSLINQVLEMSRIESGKVLLAENPADVVEKAYAMEAMCGADVERKGLSYNLVIKDVPHRNVVTDASRMTQIITNILGNAIKYTPEGGRIDYTVEELPSDREGWGLYRFTIADTGIGMSEEYLAKLFDEFTRENTATVNKIQGTGLGMSIVKKLTDLMEGSIDVKSVKGEGTTIAVTVPMKLDENGEMRRAKEAEYRSVNFTGKRILLVEDNEMNREIARDILGEAGFVVETAEDGDEAVEMVSGTVKRGDSEYYDAVLMDIQMPRMNGYEATKAIRSLDDPQHTHLPIIALSANAFEEDRKMSLEAGMDEHVAKPIDVNLLKETLARFL